jgi:hypothetical protein
MPGVARVVDGVTVRAAGCATHPSGHGELPVARLGEEPSLLAHAAVDAFAEKVGVAIVAGILLDHVHEHPTQ